MEGQWSLPDSQMIERFGPAVYRLAFSQLHSRHDADDIFQEVFLRYVEKAPAFTGPEHAKAWLLRVTLNCCRDMWRSPWRKRHVPLEEDLPFETPEEWDLHREVMALPKKYRAVLHLYYWEDLSCGEIASITGAKPGAVRQQLHRGRAKMKEILEKEGLQDV